MNKEVILTLIDSFGITDKPDYERFYRITSNKHLAYLFTDEVEKAKEKFTTRLAEEIGVDLTDTKTWIVAKIYLCGYGFVEFIVCKENKFSIEVLL